MPLYVPTPVNDETFYNQKELADVTEEEFKAYFEPKRPNRKIAFYRLLCFIVFGGVFRMILTLACLFVFYVVVSILMKFRNKFKSVEQYRSICRKVTTPLVRTCLFAIGVVRIHVKGEIEPETRTLVANHQTPFDPLCILCSKTCSFLAMAGIKSSAFMKPTGEVLEMIFVDRSKSEGVTEQLIKEQENEKKLPICVFPEGKITNGECLMGFRTGSFICRKQLQGVTIRYNQWFIPSEMATVCWCEENLLLYLYQLFSIPFLTLEVNFLPPLPFPESMSGKDRAAQVQLQMANSLGCRAIKRTNKEIFQGKKEKSE